MDTAEPNHWWEESYYGVLTTHVVTSDEYNRQMLDEIANIEAVNMAGSCKRRTVRRFVRSGLDENVSIVAKLNYPSGYSVIVGWLTFFETPSNNLRDRYYTLNYFTTHNDYRNVGICRVMVESLKMLAVRNKFAGIRTGPVWHQWLFDYFEKCGFDVCEDKQIDDNRSKTYLWRSGK